MRLPLPRCLDPNHVPMATGGAVAAARGEVGGPPVGPVGRAPCVEGSMRLLLPSFLDPIVPETPMATSGAVAAARVEEALLPRLHLRNVVVLPESVVQRRAPRRASRGRRKCRSDVVAASQRRVAPPLQPPANIRCMPGRSIRQGRTGRRRTLWARRISSHNTRSIDRAILPIGRVAFLTLTLLCGGVERYLKYTDRSVDGRKFIGRCDQGSS